MLYVKDIFDNYEILGYNIVEIFCNKGTRECFLVSILEIKSTSNAKFKYLKSLLTKKARSKNLEYTVEGIKSVSDALKSNKKINTIAVSEFFYKNYEFQYPEDVEILIVETSIFGQLCDTITPQGIIAVIKMDNTDDFKFKSDGEYVYCDNVQDPGNLGTIIRTAEAAGLDAVLLSPGCVDMYSPKVVRASMGSYFNINIITDVSIHTISDMKANGVKIIGGALNENTVDYRIADYKAPVVIVVGNEANGISDEMLKLCDCVKIPICGKAESLNVSVAAGILIYEILRNRG